MFTLISLSYKIIQDERKCIGLLRQDSRREIVTPFRRSSWKPARQCCLPSVVFKSSRCTKRYADEAHADNVFGENPYRLLITWTGVLAWSMWFGLLQSGIFFIIYFFKFPDISGLHTETL